MTLDPLLSQKSRFIARDDVTALVARLTRNLLSIRDETGEFLLPLGDGRVVDAKAWSGWEWTQGIGLYGLFKYWELTGDDKTLTILTDWFEARFREGLPTKNVNTVAPLLTLACLYEHFHEPVWVPYLDRWAEWVMREMPRTEENGLQHIVFNSVNHQQLWDDTLMMSVLPLTKIGLVLDRPHYLEEAKYQFLLHAQYLMDTHSGLWFHGWSFDGKHNFANALWARGNSWVTIAIPEFLEMTRLAKDDPIRRQLLSVLSRQAVSLKTYQDETGLWHTLIDDPSSYLEASATAGFAYGLMKSVRRHYLDAEYETVAERGMKGVVDNISADGELKQVSTGTPMGYDLDFYRQIRLTPMPYGQSMAILCLTELLRSYI